MKTVYAALWIGWIAWFLAVEFTALGTGHPQWTLSEYVWRVEEINRGWTFLRYLVAAFCLWLALHMTFGWLRLPPVTVAGPMERKRKMSEESTAPVEETGAAEGAEDESAESDHAEDGETEAVD